jgi:hypothetical protein
MTRKPSLALSATIAVDNPAHQPGHAAATATTTVRRALRDDPLGRLHARGQISAAQLNAGRRWQVAWEITEGRIMRAPDPTQPLVDRSRTAPAGPDLDQILRARARLTQWDAVLGSVGSYLVRCVLVDGRTMEQIADANGEASTRAIDYYGRRLRECLTTLADQMGL